MKKIRKSTWDVIILSIGLFLIVLFKDSISDFYFSYLWDYIGEYPTNYVYLHLFFFGLLIIPFSIFIYFKYKYWSYSVLLVVLTYIFVRITHYPLRASESTFILILIVYDILAALYLVNFLKFQLRIKAMEEYNKLKTKHIDELLKSNHSSIKFEITNNELKSISQIEHLESKIVGISRLEAFYITKLISSEDGDITIFFLDNKKEFYMGVVNKQSDSIKVFNILKQDINHAEKKLKAVFEKVKFAQKLSS